MEETLNSHRDPIVRTKLIVGIFFAIAGVLMTADNLDLFDAERVLRWWPALLVLIGVIKLADAGARLIGVILTVVGTFLLAETAGWLTMSIFDLWPLLLVGLGISMVARALGLRSPAESREAGNNIVGVLSSRKVVSTTADYRGARIAAFMGGVHLDLTGADIVQNPAVIECFVMWGGIQIIIPDGWQVIGELVPVMGGFEINIAPAAEPQRQLVVRGMALMGGVEVKRRKA